ncbi:leucine-rich repeat-containing G-protein coupled receptor 5-like isoform X1 [Acipenser ruthenus]|uniref:leucine-rich repeat-containing G-protein coupled receptor 5-like isoform X1 n=1 Tax=Acipenser ruthenus TaxID=7906 RepID=UPI002741449D|nr:leucine-rich repeat-containing G-protein coupled receptor 5-like isoform X1 [Acipenser ruthenus]
MLHPPLPDYSLVTLLLLLVGAGGGTEAGKPQRDCPSICHCEEDGMLLRVDCSDLGLTALPANLSVFTSYLDLSMNNITQLPTSALFNLHFLEELRLAGNDLTHIPKGAFSGLFNLKVLMLQNNQLRQVPSEALQNLRNLQSLRLDANHIYSVPHNSFSGLSSLRHLWLDDNSLTEVPVQGLSSLSSLQAMTLALNKITRIPDDAFANLSSLVVLHLHNNRIHSLGKKCFDGLHSLETLDLNYNNLDEFPTAIKALINLKELGFHSNNIKSIPERAFMENPSLITIFFYDNPIQFVGKSAFQHLPELRTLSLNGATEITEFPDLTGTKSLESLTLTGARITSLPKEMCEQLPSLQVLDLSYNLIQDLPTFNGCERLQKIDLHHNEIQEIQTSTFQHLTALRSLDLAWNKLCAVHPNAFSHLPSLIKLDLSSNLLSSLPVTGLHGLTHLKLAGNADLQELLSAENFPKLRVMEMPYAFQCCAFVSCENHNKLSNPWDKDENRSTDHFVKKDSGILLSQEDHDFEDFLLDFEEDPKAHHSVQCTPAPGPFRPCDHLFGSWLIRTGVWIIVVLSLVCNGLVAVTVFVSPTYISPAKHLIGLLAVVNSLMGFSSGVLAVVDTLTFGSFAKYGAWWESGIGCRITGFMSVFSSETCIFLLTTAALERGLSIKCAKRLESKSTKNNVKIVSAFCFILALAITVLPLLHVGEYGISSLCLPLPFGEPSSLGFMVALVLLNSLCYFVMTVTYTRLYCNLEKGELDNFWDCSMIKHVAWLLFANCILYFPVAFLSFSSLLNLSFISPEVIKSILLVIVPLPACLNPLLYMLFNPHFKEDLGILLKQTLLLKKSKQSSLVSLNSEDAEKQSCDSTQALVTFTSSENLGDGPESKSVSSASQIIEACHSQSVASVPCH